MKIYYKLLMGTSLTYCPYRRFIRVSTWKCDRCPYFINDNIKEKYIDCVYTELNEDNRRDGTY
jgi:C4-type Zn-finger protein